MADDPPEGPGRSPDDAFERPKGRPQGPQAWGPWATVGWSALVVAAMLAIRAVVVLAFAVAFLMRDPGADIAALVAAASADGMALVVATLASTPAVLGLVTLLAWARPPARDYLALRGLPAGKLALAALGMAAFLAASDALTIALGRPLVHPFRVDVYRTAWPPALLVAFLICAPLGEEFLFRGFFYRGVADSRWGPGLAIGLSSIAWAAIQTRYDLYGVATIYLMGLYLGLVRYWTGSLIVTILLHALANAVAAAEVAALAGRGG